MSEIYKDIESVLISEQQIKEKVAEFAEMISREYADSNPILICVLKGSVVFYADLCKLIRCKMQMDFMVVSSYGNATQSKGSVKIKKDLDNDIRDRHVIIIEDIIDSGNTLYDLKRVLEGRGPASLKIITLLDKKSRREADIMPDHYGFDIDDVFVVGYGLDYAEQYRNLPFVGILKKEIYNT